jgi:hypothetical protein
LLQESGTLPLNKKPIPAIKTQIAVSGLISTSEEKACLKKGIWNCQPARTSKAIMLDTSTGQFFRIVDLFMRSFDFLPVGSYCKLFLF